MDHSNAEPSLSTPAYQRRTPRTRLCRWALALAAWGWQALPHAASAETDAPNVALREVDAVLVGSSSFNQSFGRIIQRELSRRGFQVVRKGVSGSGLARPDFRDMHQLLETLPISSETEVVVVYLGVNDTQAAWLHPHERDGSGQTTVPFGVAEWDAIYSQRARQFLERICQRGAQRAVVVLPVDVDRPDMQRRLDRVRELQTQAAASTSCAAVVSTAGDEGHFDTGGLSRRMPDGFHMSARGAQIVWDRIEARVMELLDTDPDPFGIGGDPTP